MESSKPTFEKDIPEPTDEELNEDNEDHGIVDIDEKIEQNSTEEEEQEEPTQKQVESVSAEEKNESEEQPDGSFLTHIRRAG